MAEKSYSFEYPVRYAPCGAVGQKPGEIWYIARVRIGAEENVRLRCLEQISPGVIKDCYVFHYKEKRRIYGKWVVQEKVLFPGYVFLVSGGIETKELDRKLWHIKGVIGLLEMNDGLAVVSDEEVEFLLTIGGHRQTVEMSEGVIEQSVVRVYSGPLVGKEKYIRKIDRHKRKAFLEMPTLGEMKKVQVGLEIISKT